MRRWVIATIFFPFSMPSGVMKKTLRSFPIAVLLLVAVLMTIAPAQTWTPLFNQFPGSGAHKALLLTDGTVMVQEGGGCCYGTASWWRLTPAPFSAVGGYLDGVWSQLASMPSGYCPAAYASAVLPDGRVIVEGGEFNCHGQKETTLGAIFDPTVALAGQWTTVNPPNNWITIGDGPSVVLPDGTFMLGNCCTHDYTLYDALLDPVTLTWRFTGAFQDQYNSEHGWTLLPPMSDAATGSVIVVNCCYPVNDSRTSERYFPLLSGGTWYPAGSTIVPLWDFFGSSGEIGPAVLRPDGTVFAEGASANSSVAAHTAFYHTSSSDPAYATWTAGPDFPYDQSGKGLGAADAPAALLPNGNILVAAAVGEGIPTVFYEFTKNNQWVPVPVQAPPGAQSDRTQDINLLLLPTGQVLFMDGGKDVEIYTPGDQGYDPSWAPALAVSSCAGFCDYQIHNQSENTISGVRFNGMSQGTMFGDDSQMATNFPLVAIFSSTDESTRYCRTHDHTSMGVATGSLPVSTKFDCPGVPAGEGFLYVIANGLSSGGQLVTVVP